MLAREVLLDQKRIHRKARVDAVGHECHFCHLLHNHGVVNGLVRIFAPGKGAVVLDEDAGGVDRVDCAETEAVYNHVARLELILAFNLGFVMSAVQGIALWK